MSSTDNLAPTFLGVLVTGTIVATILVALRLWIRSSILQKTGPDDWVVLTSLVQSPSQNTITIPANSFRS